VSLACASLSAVRNRDVVTKSAWFCTAPGWPYAEGNGRTPARSSVAIGVVNSLASLLSWRP
jgi:hypothetical protein